MKLKKVCAINVKGLTFELPLSAINFIVGRNFVGKSARLDAIRLVLLGYLPELGKTNAATYSLAGGAKEMIVEGDTDNTGGLIARKWTVKGDSVKAEKRLPHFLEGGRHDLELAAMLDASTYFSLTERERVEYIVQTIPEASASFEWPAMLEQLRAHLMTDVPDAKPELVTQLFEQLEKDRRGKERDNDFAPWTSQKLLEFAAEFFDGALSIAKATSVRMLRTAQGLSELRAGETPSVNLHALEAEKIDLAARIERLTSEKARHAAAVDAAKKAREERKQLSAAIEKKGHAEHVLEELADAKKIISRQLVEIVAPVDRSEEQLAELRELATSLEGVENELAKTRADLTKIDEARRRRTQITSELAARAKVTQRLEELRKMFIRTEGSGPSPDMMNIENIRTERDAANAAHGSALANVRMIEESLERNRSELAQINGWPCCPTCGAEGSAWKRPKTAEINAAIRGLESKLETERKRSEEIALHARKLADRIYAATEELAAHRVREVSERNAQAEIARLGETLAAMEKLERELAELPDSNGGEQIAAIDGLSRSRIGYLKKRAEIDARMAEQAKARKIFEERKQYLTEQLETFERSIARAEKDLAEIAAQEKHLASLPVENATAIELVDKLQTEINVANDRLRSIDAISRKAIGRQHDLERVAQADQAVKEAQLSEELAKAAASHVRKIKAEVVEKAFRPLLELANSIFPGVLKSPLAYNDGEVGSWRDGVWVSHRTFSGTEKALCYAAIQAALASRSPFRIMVIDELGRLDDTNASKLARCVEAAIEHGAIDQFVGVDTGRGVLYRDLLGENPNVPLRIEALEEELV